MYNNILFKFATEKLSGNGYLSDAFIIGGFILVIAVGYLLGSLNFGIIFSKLFFKDDVRNHGSHNAGATNMQRTYGTAAGVITIVGDALKTVAACLIGGLMLGLLGTYFAGFACVIGHILPLYYGFKGGKGVVTVATLMAMTSIKTFLPILAIFLILVIGTKYISMGSVISAIVYPLILFNILSSNENTTAVEYVGVLFAFAVAAVVVIKHRENIKRIYNHTESKISFNKKKDGEKAENDTKEEIPEDTTENSESTKNSKPKNKGKKSKKAKKK